MPPDLSPPIAGYFASSNAHDAQALAALFTADARVHDERADHRGPDAIRDWAEGTFRQYATVLTPREAREEGGATVVTTGVEGTFPGSPIELQFRFVTEGGAIRELEIG
jgi:ketosteroid isomerase-like protein